MSPSIDDAQSSGLAAVMLLDTENIFHRRDDALGVMRERDILRALALMAEWLEERAGVRAGFVRSYGKSIDPAVEAMRNLLQTRGRDLVVMPRAATFSTTDRGRRWQLVDFSAVLTLRPDSDVEVTHVDVTWGKDRGERRLIRDDEKDREREPSPRVKLVGGGDKLLVGYVNEIEDDEVRRGYHLVIPPSSPGTRAAIGAPTGFARLTPSQAVGLQDLVNDAARRAQDPRAHPVPRPRMEPVREVADETTLVSALGRVDWGSLVGVATARADWDAKLGPRIARAARRGIADPLLRERLSHTKAASGGATIARLEDGSATRSELQAVVAAAVLFEVGKNDADRLEIRREIFGDRALAFARPAWERIQPLFAVGD